MTEARLPNAGSGPDDADAALSVETLLAALQEGDQDALRRLLPPLRERLSAVAKRRLQGADAEEAVQESLAILWEKRSAVRSGRHLLQFAFQTLRNVIGNAYLRRRRHDAAEVPERAGLSSGDWWEPEGRARGEELERILDAAIARCAEENELWGRILGWLRAGLSPVEIRDRLGDVPMATVHTRIHRARARLGAILRAQHGVESER